MGLLGGIFDKIPLQWKLLGLAVGLLTYWAAIGGSYSYTLSKGVELGELREKDKNKAAVNAALEKAIKERDEAYADLQEIEDEIFNAPDGDDGSLSPVLARELDRVHE